MRLDRLVIDYRLVRKSPMSRYVDNTRYDVMLSLEQASDHERTGKNLLRLIFMTLFGVFKEDNDISWYVETSKMTLILVWNQMNFAVDTRESEPIRDTGTAMKDRFLLIK